MDFYWPVNPWVNYQCKKFNITIPDNCTYPDVSNMYIPLISFNKENLNLKKIYIGKNI